jgi:nickel-dependent lactate racemase
LAEENGGRFSLAYGHGHQDIVVVGNNSVVLLEPKPAPGAVDVDALVREALSNPIGSRRLCEMARPGQRVAIIVSDVTRPCPTSTLLPFVLEELSCVGVASEDILIVFGLGSHRKHTEEEKKSLLGEAIYEEIRSIDSDTSHVTYLGETGRGTPVEVFTPVVQADLKIVLGNFEFHYFVGYSGGVKGAIPGVASLRTIEANHAHMVEPNAVAGHYEDNPVRQDIEEAGAMLGIDFVLNVVLDADFNVVAAVAGDPVKSHAVGRAILDEQNMVTLEKPADVVVVSAGGYPKDIDLYQSQKALDNARLAVREGGVIVLVAECSDGMGHGLFGQWMTEGLSPDQLIQRIKDKFVLGGHKAAAIALAMKRADLYLVSSFPREHVRLMGFYPYSNAADAVDAALRKVGSGAMVAIMPHGGATVPRITTA